MKNRVVVTGLGPVTQIGIGKKEFLDSLSRDNTGIIQKIPDEIREKYRIKTTHYIPHVEIPKDDLEKGMRLFSNLNSQIVVLASKLAICDSGIKIEEENEIPVILGLGIGDLSGGFKNYEKYMSHKKMDRFASPKNMPNAPAAWISIVNKLYGENFVLNAACASGTYAIGESYRRIRDGYSDVVICGGTEWLQEDSFSILKNFEGLGILDKSPDGKPRPFQKNRSGLLINDGTACCLVLESLEKAEERNAHIYAEITGFTSAMDAFSVVAIEESGKTIEKMLRKLIKGTKIDYYNAHGTGTILNDKVESEVFKRIFGEDITKQPFINSTKGILGHTFGASGAIEAVVCALAISEGIVHGNIVEKPIDNLNLLAKSRKNLSINSAVSASFGFGGHDGAILMEAVQRND